MATTTASKMIEVLRQLFAAYGLPQQIVTDNGPQFVSEANGEVERFVQTFKRSNEGWEVRWPYNFSSTAKISALVSIYTTLHYKCAAM